ncbi:ATP-binding protein [Actinorugispora endophytica]|uniref:Anti-sigma regulatory factor (Ser/Thr protein kinase) n=1 Tax=Actinorugispora endophytica TaxID=1605990 RepID=A0A4R6V349_9ACTN|nr:ATP-binding protein [Actinorugispora endophytica]TDQ54433.1 anti-sigma regulatory factor (Ser/Thr protein kinase) [Actinorugispora endophytica]
MTTFATAFVGAPEQVGAARRWLSGVLGHTPETHVPDDVRDAAALLVSECAANAIQHTHSGRPGRSFSLSVRVDPGRVRVEARNRRPYDALSAPRARRAAPDEENGRGLALVRAFAAEWGPLALEHGVFFTLTWQPDPGPDPGGTPPAAPAQAA